MTNKKRKSKAGGGGGTGEAAASSGGGGGGGRGGGGEASGVGSSNSHKRPRFYDHAKNDTSGNSRGGGGSSTNYQSSRFTNDVDKQRGYYDAAHGQFGAFPGLEDDDGEFYGPANDGVDYLKMVRSEAKSVPTLLVAGQQYQIVKSRSCPPPFILPQRPVDPSLDTLDYDDNGTDSLNYDDEPAAGEPETVPTTPLAPEEFENTLPETTPPEDEYETLTPSDPDPAGWYYDGTYTAAPPLPAPTPPTTALSLWHTSLLTSFRTFRHTFHTTSTVPFNTNNLPPISPNLKFWVRQRRWQSYILYTAPTPRVLRAMSQLHAISALEALTGAPGVKKGVQGWWAEWVWGLLVRCEVCLTAEEVSVIRELGKRALSVRGRIIDEGGHWREEPREDRRKIIEEEGEDPVGWVEPGEEEDEEKEEGEVEDSKSDKAKFGGAAVKESTESPSGMGGGGQARAEPDIETKPGESFVANPDAIDLDFIDEPDVVANPDAAIILAPIPVPASVPAPAPASVPYAPKREERTLADTLGALDMVISIVGDFFGQRDLLGEREAQAGLVMV